MKIIAKTFNTLNEAENYQNELYDQYNHVRLVRFPHFSEDGIYAWEVE